MQLIGHKSHLSSREEIPADPLESMSGASAFMPVSEPHFEEQKTGILVVDDEAIIRDMLYDALHLAGYRVDVARNGSEGYALFSRMQHDLVMTDLNMPGMDGSTLARFIKARSPKTPVILLTGSHSDHVIYMMEKGDIDLVLFKPFHLDKIKRTIDKCMQKAW